MNRADRPNTVSMIVAATQGKGELRPVKPLPPDEYENTGLKHNHYQL